MITLAASSSSLFLYRIYRGDTLASMAGRAEISVRQLVSLNPQLREDPRFSEEAAAAAPWYERGWGGRAPPGVAPTLGAAPKLADAAKAGAVKVAPKAGAQEAIRGTARGQRQGQHASGQVAPAPVPSLDQSGLATAFGLAALAVAGAWSMRAASQALGWKAAAPRKAPPPPPLPKMGGAEASVLSKALALAAPDAPLLAVCLLLLLANTACFLAVPLAIGFVFDVIRSGEATRLPFASAILFASLGCPAVINASQVRPTLGGGIKVRPSHGAHIALQDGISPPQAGRTTDVHPPAHVGAWACTLGGGGECRVGGEDLDIRPKIFPPPPSLPPPSGGAGADHVGALCGAAAAPPV